MKQLKLGLALGGGGAKGYFHIGALQALKENKISFCAVSGTSIGSIIGGMYSLGYSPYEMVRIIKEMGIYKPSFLISSKLKGLPLNRVIEKVLGERDFSDLKIPFIAVATDIDTGKEVYLGSGDLCKAMSASSTIPPAYKCVIIDKKRLIDGGFVNSVPVNAVRNLGAEKVLAIDLSAHIPMNYTAVNLLDKVYPFHKVERKRRNFAINADFALEPDLSRYKITSVSKFEQLFELGYDITKKNINLIKQKLSI